MVGETLRDARSDRADPDFGNQLHADPGGRIAVLQIVDQLLEILDGVDVVVGRRRNETDPRRGVADAGDICVDFPAGEFPSFSWLCALRDLDLKFIGVGEVVDGHSEATAGDLLDCRPFGVPVGQGFESLGILATFSCVALATHSIHGDRERFVRFGRDRPETHRAGTKSLDDFAGRFDFVERNRSTATFGAEREQSAESAAGLGIPMGMVAESAVGLAAIGAGSDLNVGDRGRIPHMPFSLRAPMKFARIG